MKSFYTLTQDYLILGKDDSTANLTLGKKLINYFLRKVLIAKKWSFHKTFSEITTIADRQWYALSFNCYKVLGIQVEVSDTTYHPKEIVNQNTWNKLNRTITTSDIPQFWRVNPYAVDGAKRLEVYPHSSSAGNTITVFYIKKIKDLSKDDLESSAASYYGTISITPGAILITGTGTSFNSSPYFGNKSIIDRWIQFTDDGDWYKITNVASDTSLIISPYFGGQSITNGYFTVGEMIPLPDGFEDIILWAALSVYYKQRGENLKMAREYEKMFKEGFVELMRVDSTTEKAFLESNKDIEDFFVLDPNDYPQDLTSE